MADKNPKKQVDDELPPLDELLGDDELPPLEDLLGGTTPAEKKNGTASPSTLAGGISNAMQGRTNAAIDAATTAPTPYSLNQVATERKKKVELNKGLKGAAQSYKDYKAANENLRNAQMDLTAGLQGEKDVIQTDVLGKPVAIQGSLTEQKIKGLQENVKIATAKRQTAKESLIKVAPAFKDKNIDIVAELQKDNTDVEETVIPQAVEKIKFVEDISDLEDRLKQNGQTLDDWSKYVDTEAPKEFLDDKQRALYDVVKTGDEGKIKQAQELYFKDIDDEVKGIDSEITKISVSGTGAIGTGQNISGQIAELRQKKQDLLDKKKGFLQPSAALKQVAEIDPSFGAFDDMFAKIPPMQRVKMTLDKLYADKIKEQARLGTTSDYAQRRQAGTGFSQITPTGEIDTKEKLRKIDQAIKVLAPIAFLNQTPDMEQSNWTRFGRGVWNTIAGDATGTSLPKKEDIADNITSLMSKASTVDNISAAGQKALKETAPTITDKAIDMASYITAIAPSYGAIGSAMQGAKIPQLVRMAFGNIGKYSPLLGRVTPYLARMTSEGITSELTGRALGGNAQQDLTFLSKFGAQGATELFNKSPFGKLVTKAVSSLGIKEVPKFVNILANINSAGTGSLIEEGVEEGIVMYQNSDSFADFKKQLKQFVDSPSDLFLFVASSYALGGFTSGLSPNVSNKFYQAADKAYSDLPPDEKTAFDNVVKDVNQGQEDAVMEVVLKTVDKVPNKVVDGLVTDLNTAVEELGKTEVGEDGYEVKIGDTVYQGNTAQDLQNDIDDAQSLLAIYKGEQDNRTQNGITIEETETPPIAEADQTDVEQPKPEAGVGVGEALIKETPEKVKQEQPLVKQSDTANLPQDVQDKIADLRAKEQTDLKAAIPNIDDYKVNGVIDRAKIQASPDADAYNKIYDQYNAPITALFESGKNQPQEVEVKETVSEKQPTAKEKAQRAFEEDEEFDDSVLIELSKDTEKQESYDNADKTTGTGQRVLEAVESEAKDVEGDTGGGRKRKAKAVVEKIDTEIKNGNVKNVPIKSIDTNVGEYQPRKTKFSENSVNKIVKNFDKNALDPITVYKHPDGKTYVLSGHSRFEAMKRLGKKEIPVRFFEGTPAQAKEFAQKSNKFATAQNIVENADYYRKKKAEGASHNAMMNEAKESEPEGEAKKTVAISYLSPNGKAIATISSLATEESGGRVLAIQAAAVVGDLKRQNPQISTLQENELFDYLFENNNSKQAKEVAQRAAVPTLTFDPNESLNLNKAKLKSENVSDWEKRKSELEAEIKEKRKLYEKDKKTGLTGLEQQYIDALVPDFMRKGQTAEQAFENAKKLLTEDKAVKEGYNKKIQQAKDQVKVLQDKYQAHLATKNTLSTAEKAQINIFDFIADNLESLKTGKGDESISSIVPPEVWNTAIGVVQTVLRKTADFDRALRQGAAYIKSTDWYKNATKQQRETAIDEYAKAIEDIEKQTTEKVDEKRESPKATETDLGKKQGAPKKQAIPTESIDNLVKGGTKRKAALESIAEPKIADVAKALTDTKGLAKIMDILNGDTDALTELENSIGFKKIC